MPNIASVLKSEISRLARKEIREETEILKRSITTHRSEIAALKRRIHEMERILRKLAASGVKGESPVTRGSAFRFSAKGLAAQRRRLDLSAHDIGLLVGTTGQSIYNWEAGKAKPRTAHESALAALMRLSKRQAESILMERREK